MLKPFARTFVTAACPALSVRCLVCPRRARHASCRDARRPPNGRVTIATPDARHATSREPSSIVAGSGRADGAASRAVASSTVLLGDSAVESQYDSLVAGEAEAFRLQAGASGLAGLVHVYISSGNAAKTVIVGLYSNSQAVLARC